MKWSRGKKTLFAALALALLISGCGSSSSPNTITVSVSPSAVTVFAGQVAAPPFTAVVSGSTNTTVTNWSCTYSYTPAGTNPKPITGMCTSGGTISGNGESGSFGTWTISTANGSNVLTYTAPKLDDFPKPYKPVLTFTATADADKKKTGTATVQLDSGIRVQISPPTATVPVGITPPVQQTFGVTFQNSPPVNVQYKLVQPNSANTTNPNDQTANPLADTCTVSSPTTTNPGCGSIDANGIYTPPMTLPTDTVPAGSKSTLPTTVMVVAWSGSDQSEFAVANITLVNATTNPASFTGLYPDTIAAGGLLQDVFLNAKNLLNTAQIFFISPTSSDFKNAQLTRLNNSSQVFGGIPVSGAYCTPSAANVTPAIKCDASILTRVRLQAAQLGQAEPVIPQGQPPQPAWIMIANLPGQIAPPAGSPCVVFPTSGTATTAIACPLHIVNASPGLVAAVPESIQQVGGTTSVSVGVDGGYYGPSGSSAQLQFAGQNIGLTANSGPRQLKGTTASFQLPNPGLYEVSVNASTGSGAPPTFPTAITNAAVQPNFANFTPNPLNTPSATCINPSIPAPPTNLSGAFPNCLLLNGGGNPAPSDIALDSVNQFAVIAEQGAGNIQLVDLSGSFPVQSGAPFAVGTSNSQPTSVALDSQLNLTVNGNSNGELLAVLASGDNKLYLYGVSPPRNGAAPPTLLNSFAIDLPTLLGLPSSTTTLGTPFSIGIDPGTHLGVVAYESTNVGFIVDVNPNLDGKDTHTCFLANTKPPCAIAPVSVVTGKTPKVVMAPNLPLAYVTPAGGPSNTSVVDLLQQAKSVQIAPFVSGKTSGAVRTAGITKIITATDNGINPLLGGTVIISGVMPTKSCSNFNGTFQILPGTVTPFTFSYSQPDQINCDDVESNPQNMLGTVQYGVPFSSLSTGSLVSGAAINPITHTFAFANYNNSTGQIGFISTLNQAQTSLTLSPGSCATGCTATTGSELGFRSVSFDQFTNILVAFAPTANADPNENGNKISLINPGGPVENGAFNSPTRIIAAIPTGQIGQGSYTPAGSNTAVPVYGPMVYDPKSKFVLVVNAGSNSLSYMNLDVDPTHPFQQAHIQDLRLPNPACQNAADPTTCFGVPVIQPPLSTSAPAHAPGVCSPGNPTQPCMPQAVQVGKAATVRILGQGFTNIGAINTRVPVRLDGQASVTPPGQTQAIPIAGTVLSDSEVDVTLPAAVLFAPHDYAVDLQLPAGGGTTNAIGLHVVGLLDMASGGPNGCAPTTSFPQGPEAVAIDQTRHVALVTNFACNKVSVITLNPTGFMTSGGAVVPYGGIIGSVAVGNQPLGIAVIPRLGYAVVANSGDTPNGTAMIIDYGNQQTPDNPKLVTWMTSGSTTSSNSVIVGLFPVGVAIDQDRALALIANNGDNTMTSIDLTVLLPDDPSTGGGHVHSAPVATHVALTGSPTAIAIDPNRSVAAVTKLQNPGTTAVTAGIDFISLATSPPVRTSTGSISSLGASLTGIVYDPGDPNNTTSTTTGLFFATSTQTNVVYQINPDTGVAASVQVGINPFSLGYNFQTGTLLTINSASNSSSVVDVLNFRTRQTLGISSMSQFAVDVDNFSNVAVIADQNNNRMVYLEMPK